MPSVSICRLSLVPNNLVTLGPVLYVKSVIQVVLGRSLDLLQTTFPY